MSKEETRDRISDSSLLYHRMLRIIRGKAKKRIAQLRHTGDGFEWTWDSLSATLSPVF